MNIEDTYRMLLDPDSLGKIRRNQQKALELFKTTPDHLQQETFRRTFQASASQVKNLQVNVETEGYSLILDQPSRNGGNEKGPCPVSMLLGAYAACLEMSWLVLISLSKLNVEFVKVQIMGELDGRYSLGKSKSPLARLTKIKITTFLKTTESHSKFESLMRKAIEMCPVGGSLHYDIKKTYVIEYRQK